jgi:hypothetical protein
LTAIRYKQELTEKTIDDLNGCYGGLAVRPKEIFGLTMRLGHCIDDSNLYIGEDLHNRETGECFDGRGSLWSCGSRFCAFCVGKPSKESRKKIRYVMDNLKLLVGEDWYFNTFTMPDLALKGLTLEQVAAIKQTAWKKFAHYEPNAAKSLTWFQNHFRGGFKNCEFTYTKYAVFHYHLHGLMVGSYKIKRNNFVEIRQEWTKALKFAFKKHGVKWQCDTKDGLAVVNVLKVDMSNKEKVIFEIAKYVTKADSWSNIPDEQLVEIATMARFFRMFESFGVCRRIARRMKEKPATTKQTTVFNLLNLLSNLIQTPYLDTTKIIPSVLALLSDNFPNAPPNPKKKSWFRRLRDGEISLDDYADELEDTVAKVVNFRKIQLRRMYPYAILKTVGGYAF